jgi:hypothetical protein
LEAAEQVYWTISAAFAVEPLPLAAHGSERESI